MTAKEVLKICRERGCTLEEGKKHTKIIAPDGRSTRVWRHTRDIPHGTLISMQKEIGFPFT